MAIAPLRALTVAVRSWATGSIALVTPVARADPGGHGPIVERVRNVNGTAFAVGLSCQGAAVRGDSRWDGIKGDGQGRSSTTNLPDWLPEPRELAVRTVPRVLTSGAEMARTRPLAGGLSIAGLSWGRGT